MKTLKILFLAFLLFSVTLLSSCMFPRPMHGGKGGFKAPHGHSKPHSNNSTHNNSGHNNK